MTASRTAALFLVVAAALAPTAQAQAAHDHAPGAVQAPSVGDVFMPFEAMGIDGKARWIGFEKGSTTILLFFLSGCPSCHKQIPEWNRAFERKPADVTVLGVLMDQEPPGFFYTIPISFPVLRSPGRAFLENLKVHRAPLTVRVTSGGKVEDVALGQTDPIRLGELFRSAKPTAAR
jgi:Redoxin